MSYIRASGPMVYVKADSSDYVYSDGERIVDYGMVSNDALIEMLYHFWKTDDKLFKDYLIRKLASSLNVKLRDKPLINIE